jgi:hypothetical protein
MPQSASVCCTTSGCRSAMLPDNSLLNKGSGNHATLCLGVGYNIDSQWHVALKGRYIGTTNANVVINDVNVR